MLPRFSRRDLKTVNKKLGGAEGNQQPTFNVFNFRFTSNAVMDFHQQPPDDQSIFRVPGGAGAPHGSVVAFMSL